MSVVWAASCDRNFGGMLENSFEHSEIRIAFQQAASEVLQNFSHTQVKSTNSLFFCSHFPVFPLCMPPTCHLSPSEPHRNLIGTSSEPHRMITPSSSNYQQDSNSLKQLSFNVIIQPRRYRRFTLRIGHALMSACFAQGSTVFIFPRFALHRVTQDNACLS